MASSLASDSLLFECTEENCKSVLHYKCFSVLIIQSNLGILTLGVWIQCSAALFTYIPFISSCSTNYLLYFLTFSNCNLHLRRWPVNLHLYWYSNYPKQLFYIPDHCTWIPKVHLLWAVLPQFSKGDINRISLPDCWRLMISTGKCWYRH